jgi:hypothetical protein
VLAEHGAAVRIGFALPGNGHAGALKPKVYSADT